MLRGKRLVGPVSAPQGVLAYRFKPRTGGSGETIALWSPQADAAVELPSAAERVTRINGIGEESELQVQAGRVSVKLKKGAPVYLVVRSVSE